MSSEPKKRRSAKQDFAVDFNVYLDQKSGQLDGIIELLEAVPVDGWLQLEKHHPESAERLATLAAKLSELIRSAACLTATDQSFFDRTGL